MGNSSSTNVFLTINESKACIRAGSTISGEIRGSLRSSVPISNDLFSGVKLYFIGKEEVEVCYTDEHGSHGPKYKAAKRDIVRTVIPVDTTNNHDGCYPFQFRIPDQLPSSMYYKDGNGGYCSIRYKIKMQLLRGRDQEVPIEIVAKPPSNVPHPSSADPMLARIQFMYCIPQGSLTWAAGVDDTRVGVGEELRINLGIKNESLCRLERVTAKLKQTVSWQSSGHHSTNKSVIRSTSFSRTDSMTEWNKDQLRLKRHRSKGSKAAQPLTVYEEVLETLQEGNNQVAFPIPEYVCQSYTGRLIKIHHYISITAKTPSGFTSPKIHIPIEVVSPRDTPVVAAQVIPIQIPMPSAPPLTSNDFLASSDVGAGDAPFLSSTFLVGSPVSNESEEEEEIAIDSVVEQKPSEPGAEVSIYCETSPTPAVPFDPMLVEPFLPREGVGAVDSNKI